jgi:hypothetical protein
MSDFELMQNMMVGPPIKEPLMKDKQPKILLDINNKNYSSGQINLDTRDLVQDWNCMRNNYQAIPITIGVNGALTATNSLGSVTIAASAAGQTPSAFVCTNGVISGPPGTATTGGTNIVPNIAFKQSILDLISGVTVATGDQTQILSELNSPKLINNIRLLVENNLDWANTYSTEFAFAKDTSSTILNSAGTVINAGFNTRGQSLFQNAVLTYYPLTTGATTAYVSLLQTVIYIPFRFIHSFFDNMDYPTKGIRWLINFALCKELNPNATYPGFVYNSTNITTAPTFFVGAAPNGSAVVIGNQSYPGCFMGYNSITLPNMFQQKVAELSLNGQLNTKYVRFAVTELYNSFTNIAAALNSTQLSTGVVKPIRLWIFGCPTGNLTSSTALNTTNMSLSSLNVRINNTNRYTQPLQNQRDLWQQVRDQMQNLGSTNDRGSLLQFTDFFTSSYTAPAVTTSGSYVYQNGLYSIYCIELDYIQERTDDQAVSLIMDTVGTFSGNSDVVVLVEREMVCKMTFDNNRCDIVVGSNI